MNKEWQLVVFYRILWPENLYKCTTFYLFLSLHFDPEELAWVASVLSAKNPLVEKIICKGTWCLNTAMLVSPHFKQFQYFHRNVSGFALSTLSPPWLPEWPGPEKRPGFDRYCNKLQRKINPPPERIVWCCSQWQPAYTQMLVAMPNIEFVKGIRFLFWCEQTEFDRVWWSYDWRQ